MTETEYQKIMREAADHVRRTSFPPADDEESEYDRHGHHVEFGAARH